MPRPLPKKYTFKDRASPERRAQLIKAGSVKSEKKARAARDNGLLGGRPRKKKIPIFLSESPFRLNLEN